VSSERTCAEPTATYRDTRTTESIASPAGPDSPCDVGTFLDPSYRFEAPTSDLPGCTSKRESSPDGCTRRVETTCTTSSGDQTCVETIVLSDDLSKYAGTVVCKGTYAGVDDTGPYECKTTIHGEKNP
jgi:hypothetical protein